MWTKSKIQLITEEQDRVSNYKQSIEKLLEEYNIEDSVFGFANGNLFQPHTGYFCSVCESNNLDDLFENMNSNSYIRITESGFERGVIYGRLSDCPETSNVIELN